MSLTKEQKDFGSGKKPVLNATPSQLLEFFKPFIEVSEKVKIFRESFCGEVNAGCSLLGCGCIFPIVALIIMGIVAGFCDDRTANVYGLASFLALCETLCIIYFYNLYFQKKYEGVPENLDLLTKLIIPLVGIISQDMKADEKIEINTSLKSMNNPSNKLSYQQIKAMGKALKKGLNVYAGNLLNLSTQLADETKITFDITGVVSTVYVHKKRRADKSSRKEKYTIKSIFTFPTKTYKPLPEGSLAINLEGAIANVIQGEKIQKVTVKKVIEKNSGSAFDSLVDYNDLLEACIDSMAATYSQIEAN